MATQITITLVDESYHRFAWLARLTGRELEDVVADSINFRLPDLNPRIYPPVETLTDDEVIALAGLQMSDAQADRLSELADKLQRVGALSEVENAERLALLELYEIALLRKSEGLREAVQRDLMPPLQ